MRPLFPSIMSSGIRRKETKRKREPPTLSYICEWESCPEEPFTDVSLFLNHLRIHCETHIRQHEGPEIASGESILKCSWAGCGEANFSSSDEMRLHISYHGFHSKLMAIGTEALKQLNIRFEKPLSCRNDSSSRTVLPELPQHFLCCWTHCDTDFQDAESFYQHVAHHAMEDIQIPSLSREQLKKTRFAVCRWVTCQMSFCTKTHLKSHLKTHTQEKSVACPTCGAMFHDRQKFLDHVMRQFKLDVNDSDDSDSSDDGDSKSKRSQKKGQFVCSECSEEFLTLRLLKEHFRRHRTQATCGICGFQTDTNSSLKKHYSYRHSDYRPFGCQFCSAKFKSKTDLRSHIYIHNEENPFKCTLCDFEARCGSTLSVHHKSVHENQPPQYECTFCLKRYTRGVNLTQHLMKLHDMRLPENRSKFAYAVGADGVYRLTS